MVNSMLSIGLMSGTSMDGIDASLLLTDGQANIKELASYQYDYSNDVKVLLKSLERAISKAFGDLGMARSIYLREFENYLKTELLLNTDAIQRKLVFFQEYLNNVTQTNSELSLDKVILLSTLLHANAVKALLEVANYDASDIDIIGYHGQTMYHNPSRRISLQVGNGALLANLTNIKVIDNFREQDITLGGQGAPFAPIYHQALAIRDARVPLIFANCGGIANITIVKSKNYIDLQGFDTGPGNGLVDAFIKMRTKNKECMDFNGKYGNMGKVCHEMLEILFAKSALKNGENFYTKLPPKSLDIRDLKLIPELDKLSIEDGAATLEAFTAEMIVSSLLMLTDVPEFWVLSGGGFNNPVIVEELKTRLCNFYKKEINIVNSTSLGWSSKSLEAQIFAYLAVRSLQNLPLSFPGTTGVAYPVSGGRQHNPDPQSLGFHI